MNLHYTEPVYKKPAVWFMWPNPNLLNVCLLYAHTHKYTRRFVSPNGERTTEPRFTDDNNTCPRPIQYPNVVSHQRQTLLKQSSVTPEKPFTLDDPHHHHPL